MAKDRFLINGEKVYIDFDKCYTDYLFLKYKERLLHMVGICSSQEKVVAADKYIYDNFEHYRQFIIL